MQDLIVLNILRLIEIDWISGNAKGVWEKAKSEIGFPMVS
jgi:hypothetical protein